MQHASDQLITTAKRQRAFARLAVLALVLLQLANVVHHDDHTATELAETCVACMQLDSPVLSAGEPASFAPMPLPESDRGQLDQPLAVRTIHARPPPRASPST